MRRPKKGARDDTVRRNELIQKADHVVNVQHDKKNHKAHPGNKDNVHKDEHDEQERHGEQESKVERAEKVYHVEESLSAWWQGQIGAWPTHHDHWTKIHASRHMNINHAFVYI